MATKAAEEETTTEDAEVSSDDKKIAELVAQQQKNSADRAEAEEKFREKGQELQFQIDKLQAKKRFGALSAADREALQELSEESEEE